ncbi:hypothetical protein ADIS_0716 [Lunatimonas lonarensis]|uniref:Uncharacterized protein n=1 Tax=Lunatimonas lonarensis TaxID=1232681 RepID=R7ZXU8_9BACT|nr:hypothetical protein ADIS_0716 [Lunatimonas lonarensis]
MYWSIDGLFERDLLPEKQRIRVIKNYITKIKEDKKTKKRG